jgi:uncharacterized C2H2 Zn-finger protein
VTRPFRCCLCNLAFKSRQFLQRHMTAHSDSREFVCQFCDCTYKYKKGLNRHVKKCHNLCVRTSQPPVRREFKVEDYLDLGESELYPVKKVIDEKTGEGVEILFWLKRKSINLI